VNVDKMEEAGNQSLIRVYSDATKNRCEPHQKE